MTRLIRWSRRHWTFLAAAWWIAFLPFVAWWCVSLGARPDERQIVAYARDAIDRALRAHAEERLPGPGDTVGTVSTEQSLNVPGNLLVEWQARVSAREDVKLGPKGDSVAPVEGTRELRVVALEVQTRWPWVGGALFLAAVWAALLAWARLARRYEIFVSYDHRDRSSVMEIVDRIETAGARVWIDREVKGGERWRDEINRVMGRSEVAVVFVGRGQLGNVQEMEARALEVHADAGRCRVVYFILPVCQEVPPDTPKERTWIDGRLQAPDPLAQLIDAIDAGA